MADQSAKFEEEIARGLSFMGKGNFKEAKKRFEKARAIGQKKLKDQKFVARAEGYSFLCEGIEIHSGGSSTQELVEAMKSFGRATVKFSGGNWEEEAQQARIQQAQIQMEVARLRGGEGALVEAARMYETAALTYQMAGLEKESHQARARSLVQQAAVASNDFEKADSLQAAVEEFRQAQENSLIIEAHAYFYRGRSLITVKPKEAVENLKRAYEIYEGEGANKQAEKVVLELEKLKKDIESHPGEYERRRTLMR